ncbi:MAG: DUF3025 domain-containing protein [Thiobacillus sp.]
MTRHFVSTYQVLALNFAHPVFAPYQQEIAALGLGNTMPQLSTFNALALSRGLVNSQGLPLRFTAPGKSLAARDYEQQILHTGCVPTRIDTWHDVMNALVWLRFPQFKAALNAAHGEAIVAETGSRRERRRDALTMLDESGVWVASKNALLNDLLRQRAWQTLFFTQRALVNTQMQFVVVGHALLEKMLQPYAAITGKCLVLEGDVDLNSFDLQASHALAAIQSPNQLVPLPLMGIPGWDPHNAQAAYYANAAVFRPLPAS